MNEILNQLEKSKLDIGIVALTDCVPLIVAQKLDYFTQLGLEVNLHLQPSWATVRDRLQTNMLDAAQLLAPMTIASGLGINGAKLDLINAFNLSMNGNGITLSNSLMHEIKTFNQDKLPDFPLDASWIKKVIDNRKSQQQSKLKFATVYPFSCHFYQLRDWLGSAGINCNQDIDVIVIPPTNMNTALEQEDIDGFCVGNPWNAKAVRAKLGYTVITSNDIWQDAPEKVLAVRESWQQQHPNTFIALLAAVQKACLWLKSPANRFEAAIMLQEYLNEPLEVIAPSLVGSCIVGPDVSPRELPTYNRFINNEANRPKKAQGQLLLEKMLLAGQINATKTEQEQTLNSVYREDIYEQMLEFLNQYSEKK